MVIIRSLLIDLGISILLTGFVQIIHSLCGKAWERFKYKLSLTILRLVLTNLYKSQVK